MVLSIGDDPTEGQTNLCNTKNFLNAPKIFDQISSIHTAVDHTLCGLMQKNPESFVLYSLT